MSGAIFARIRDWYIVVIGAVLIIGGLYLASPQTSPVQTVKEPTTPAAAPANTPEASSAPQPPVAEDVAKGEQVFRICRACHSLEAGKVILGPSLGGVFGRKAGTIPNYNYSPAMKNAKVVWDAANLDAYLQDPKKFLPGNKMAFPGLKKDEDRSNVIAYLAANSAPQK